MSQHNEKNPHQHQSPLHDSSEAKPGMDSLAPEDGSHRPAAEPTPPGAQPTAPGSLKAPDTRNEKQLQIPGWDFQGACLGLDIRRVVETGITPLINTGIAHKEAGIGQIGAGTVRAPLACFEQALEALAESMGIG